MNLSFVLMGVLSILCAFGVFESILKICGLNRLLVSLFFLVGAVLSLFGSINIFGYEISLNIFNFTLVFVILLPKLKNAKNIISMLLCSLIILATFVCYNAFDLTNFEYNFVQPYVYMAIILGIIFSIFVKNISSVFCGSYIGSIIFEIVAFDMFGKNMETNFLLGGEMMVTSIIIICLTYAIFFWLKNFVTNLKLKKKTKSLN